MNAVIVYINYRVRRRRNLGQGNVVNESGYRMSIKRTVPNSNSLGGSFWSFSEVENVCHVRVISCPIDKLQCDLPLERPLEITVIFPGHQMGRSEQVRSLACVQSIAFNSETHLVSTRMGVTWRGIVTVALVLV